jgi:hypothetical protein
MAERGDTGTDTRLGEVFLEVRDTLEEADAWGEELFGDPADPESRDRLVEIVHAVKDACDLLPLPRLEAVAEAAAEAADTLHDRSAVPTPATMTTILSAIGRMRDILARVETEGAEPSGDDAALIGALGAIAGREAVSVQEPEPEARPLADAGAGDVVESEAEPDDEAGKEGEYNTTDNAGRHRLYVIFRLGTGGPLAVDAAHVAWMDLVDAVAAGPDGIATVTVRGEAVRLVVASDVPGIGRLPAPRSVIVLKRGNRRLALMVEDIVAVSPNFAAVLSAAAEIVAVERLFGE